MSLHVLLPRQPLPPLPLLEVPLLGGEHFQLAGAPAPTFAMTQRVRSDGYTVQSPQQVTRLRPACFEA